MSSDKPKSFREKHPGEEPDSMIKEKIMGLAKEGKIPCAVAFEAAGDLGENPEKIGKTIDLLDYRLTRCQLGLFGYAPEKKIVKPVQEENRAVKEAIHGRQKDGRLSCRHAWDIAEDLQVRKMTVSGHCEGMGIKIKPCQLGAF